MEEVGATSTTQAITPAHVSVEGSGIQAADNAKSIDPYDSQCRTALWVARIVGALHSLCKFLTVCGLTWATVVLLGAFVGSLQFIDYTMVSCLLLLEAIRLASAVFFTQLLTRALAYLSQSPTQIHHDKDFHHPRALQVLILSCFLQALLILPSFVAPVIRLREINYKIPSNVDNLQNSLRIFYTLVVINASISLLSLGCSCIAYIHLSDSSEQSILRYYDQVLLNALKSGIVQADDFHFLDFAYKILGKDYARNVQTEAVVKNHKKLLNYLYTHRQGFDYLQIYLDAGKASEWQAAANMVGIWADPNWGVDEKHGLKLPDALLTKLADRLGTGQVGWAACNSFGGLARRDPKLLSKTKTSSKKRVMDVLAELMDGSSSRSLVAVRTLVLFYNYLDVKEKPPLPEKIGEMVAELKKLFRGSKVLRLKVLSAYLLHLLGRLDSESVKELIMKIIPGKDDYFFTSEVEMLKNFYEMIGVDPPPFPGKIHEDKDTLKHPTWIINTQATAFLTPSPSPSPSSSSSTTTE